MTVPNGYVGITILTSTGYCSTNFWNNNGGKFTTGALDEFVRDDLDTCSDFEIHDVSISNAAYHYNTITSSMDISRIVTKCYRRLIFEKSLLRLA